jgi:hypothetical protein
MRISTLVLGMVLAATWVAGAAAEPNLYERVEARLKADPALAEQLGKPTPEIKSLSWMVGTWDVTATVQAGSAATGTSDKGQSVIAFALDGTWIEARDTYPGGGQDVGYVTYNPVVKQWIALGIDGAGNAVTTMATGWTGNRLVFTGEVTIVGERVTLRQTIEKLNDAAYNVINEQKMADGSWLVLGSLRIPQARELARNACLDFSARSLCRGYSVPTADR